MSNVAPSFEPIQIESLQFNQPISEASVVAMGGAINGLLQVNLPVGSVVMAALTESQFQNSIGNPSPATWVLSDGRNVSGSAYQINTGNTTIPDLRGVFPRGSDGGTDAYGTNTPTVTSPRGLDPNGPQAVGTYVGDQFAAHVHTYQSPFGGSGGGSASGTTGRAPVVNTSTTGGAETAPKTTYVNFFIRIN